MTVETRALCATLFTAFVFSGVLVSAGIGFAAVTDEAV